MTQLVGVRLRFESDVSSPRFIFFIIQPYLCSFSSLIVPKCNVVLPSRKGLKLKTVPVSEKLKILDRIESGASTHIVFINFLVFICTNL